MRGDLPETLEQLEREAVMQSPSPGRFFMPSGLVLIWQDGTAVIVGRWDPPLLG